MISPRRRTLTYCKPLVVLPNDPPRELNRLDSKNWTPTPRDVEDELIRRLRAIAERVDALILLDQVDLAETGVVTGRLLAAVREISIARPGLGTTGTASIAQIEELLSETGA